MARRPRFYRPGVVYECTSRTRDGIFRLRPSDESTEMILGVVGRAMHLWPSVKLHIQNPISNHNTWLLSSDDKPKDIPKFIGFVKSNISKELKRLYGLRSGIFERRERVIPISPDQLSLESRFRYVMAQGTKEGLVKSPRDWPGVTTVHALERGVALAGWWFDRTAESRARARGETFDKYEHATRYSVRVSRLPCWEHLTEDEWRTRVTEIVEDIVETESKRRNADGVDAMGAAAVQSMSASHRPTTLAQSPAPLVHAATRALRRAFRAIYELYCAAFRDAAEDQKRGKSNVAFPAYSFPPGQPMVPGAATDALEDLMLVLRPG